MSVLDEIARIGNAKADIKAALEAKGVTVQSFLTLDSYAALVASIPTGSTPTVATATGTRSSATQISFPVAGQPKMWALILAREDGLYISGSSTRYITSAISDGTTVYTTCIYRSGSTAREYCYSNSSAIYSNGTLVITSASASTSGSFYNGSDYYRLIYIY